MTDIRQLGTVSAHDPQLLIKQLLMTPVVSSPHQEIVYRGTKRYSYLELHERIFREKYLPKV